MRLTKPQVTLFWRLWKRASDAQHWTVKAGMSRQEIDQRRHEVLGRCGFESLTHVDRTEGFGRVKAALMTLCGSVDGAIETDHPEADEARRLKHVITYRILPGLARLPSIAAVPGGAIAYCERICRDKFGLPDDWELDLDDLGGHPLRGPSSTDRLRQLLITLNARLRKKEEAVENGIN